MSDHWRELVGRLDVIEDQPELADIQLNRCLLAMARYLVKTDRQKPERLVPGEALWQGRANDSPRN